MTLADRDLVNPQTDYATPLLVGTTATLTEARCRSPQGWNISNRRGFFWASGEYRCSLYNHYLSPNDSKIDCIGSRAFPSEDIKTRFPPLAGGRPVMAGIPAACTSSLPTVPSISSTKGSVPPSGAPAATRAGSEIGHIE
ncbi:MAG: hypothetical protein U1D30_25290 [Planctomycetota bacterium]